MSPAAMNWPEDTPTMECLGGENERLDSNGHPDPSTYIFISEATHTRDMYEYAPPQFPMAPRPTHRPPIYDEELPPPECIFMNPLCWIIILILLLWIGIHVIF